MKIKNVKIYLLIVIVAMVIHNVNIFCENLLKIMQNFTNLLLIFVYIPASN